MVSHFPILTGSEFILSESQLMTNSCLSDHQVKILLYSGNLLISLHLTKT
jgi:hypothetical protein